MISNIEFNELEKGKLIPVVDKVLPLELLWIKSLD